MNTDFAGEFGDGEVPVWIVVNPLDGRVDPGRGVLFVSKRAGCRVVDEFENEGFDGHGRG